MQKQSYNVFANSCFGRLWYETAMPIYAGDVYDCFHAAMAVLGSCVQEKLYVSQNLEKLLPGPLQKMLKKIPKKELSYKEDTCLVQQLVSQKQSCKYNAYLFKKKKNIRLWILGKIPWLEVQCL